MQSQHDLAEWFEANGFCTIMDADEQWIESLGVYPRDVHLALPAIKRIPEATQLKTLKLTNMPSLTGSHLECLDGMDSLQQLRMEGSPVSGDGLKILPGLRGLRYFGCHLWEEADVGLEHIGQCTRLVHLNLPDSYNISDAGMVSLSHLSELEHFGIDYCNIGPGATVVSQMPVLRNLYAQGTRIGPDEIPMLCMARKLESLWLPWGFDDNSLRLISQLPQLQTLSLGGNVTSEGISALLRMSKLTELIIPCLKFDRMSMELLFDNQTITSIALSDINSTEADADELRQPFRRVDRFENACNLEAARTIRLAYKQWLKTAKK